MTIGLPLLIGAGMGLGVWVVVHGLHRRPLSLGELVAALDRPGVAVTDTVAGRSRPGVRDRLGHVGVRILESLTFVDLGVVRRDLRVLDKTLETHAFEKLLAGVVGLIAPAFLIVGLGLVGVTLPPLFTLTFSLVLGCAAFLYPDFPLRDQADERRITFRRSLSAFLDLTTIFIAGGAHENQAMTQAADAGEGWAFEQIRAALRSARNTSRDIWEMLDALGIDLGIDELCELAASITLSGAEGAAIKETLVAAADSMRFTQLAEVEATAESQTQKMVLPLMIIALGFILFIGYGVIAAMDTGTSTQLDPAPPISTQR
jgi:tight adherence protein C